MNQDKNNNKDTPASTRKSSVMDAVGIAPAEYKRLYEKEATKNRNLYLSLFWDQKTIMMMVEVSTMRIVDANQAAVAFYGYPYEILTKMYAYQLTTFPKEKLAKRIQQASNQEQIPFYGQHILANKEVRDVEVRNAEINFEGRELLFVTVYDITERVKAKKALERSEEKFRKIFKTSPDAVSISSIKEGKYIEVNEGFTAITGYTPEETEGKTSSEIDIWVDKKDRNRLVKILKEKGSVKNFAAQFRMKDGSIIHGLMSSNIIEINGLPHILSITRNIEEFVKTNEALRQSEMKFRKAFKISPDSININRIEDGMYVDINEGFTAITGYTAEDVRGKTSHEINIWVDSKDREYLVKTLKKKGVMRNFAARFRMKNGSIIHGLMSANFIDINGEPHILTVTRNIEDYVKTNEAFQQSEQRYKTLFNLLPAGLMLIDDRGTILDANPTYCKNIGYAAEEIIGEKIWKVVNNPLQEKKEQILNYIPSIPKDKIAEKEVINFRKDGEPIYLHLYETRILLENNQPAVLSISMDVTREKYIREELAKNTHRLKEAQNIGRLGSWELDWQAKKLYWSDGMYHLLELSPSQLPNYSLFQQRIHPDDLKASREVLKEAIKSGKSFKHIHRLLLEDNKIKWVIERGKSFYDKNKRIVRIHGTIQDITRLKETEDKLRELNELLEERVRDRTVKLKKKQQDLSKLLNDMQVIQQKMRNTNYALQNLNHELEAFSYSVSHDLKAPLRAIHGFTTILKEEYYTNLDQEGKTLADDILMETERMAEIIDALLHLSRTGRKSLTFVEFDLAPLARSIFIEQEKQYNLPQARLYIHELPTVYADYSLIKQLMANLFSNALKYSANEPYPLVEIGISEDEKIDETVFYVKDNGVGFEEESAGRMFDAFRRLHSKKEFEGTGIGLAIAKRIITRHGGKIWAKSQPGKGASLFFTLSGTDKREEL